MKICDFKKSRGELMKISRFAEIINGTAQFRIVESINNSDHDYVVYDQNHLIADLTFESRSENKIAKHIRTSNSVQTLNSGDLVYSLVSGMAAIVSEKHSGFLQTRNYLKIVPNGTYDKQYLAFMLNESRDVRRQIAKNIQGSVIVKLSSEVVSNIDIQETNFEIQRKIGGTYMNYQKVSSLRAKKQELEKSLLIGTLESLSDGGEYYGNL